MSTPANDLSLARTGDSRAVARHAARDAHRDRALRDLAADTRAAARAIRDALMRGDLTPDHLRHTLSEIAADLDVAATHHGGAL